MVGAFTNPIIEFNRNVFSHKIEKFTQQNVAIKSCLLVPDARM